MIIQVSKHILSDIALETFDYLYSPGAYKLYYLITLQLLKLLKKLKRSLNLTFGALVSFSTSYYPDSFRSRARVQKKARKTSSMLSSSLNGYTKKLPWKQLGFSCGYSRGHHGKFSSFNLILEKVKILKYSCRKFFSYSNNLITDTSSNNRKRPTLEEVQNHRWMNPADYMYKKRGRANFNSNRIQVGFHVKTKMCTFICSIYIYIYIYIYI